MFRITGVVPLAVGVGTLERLLPLLIGLLALSAAPANAGVVKLDFTNSTPWAQAQNQTSFTTMIGDLTVTLTASVGSNSKITFNSSTNERAGCKRGWTGSIHDLACGGDGLGVGDDEITEGGIERITVDFSRPVQLTNIELMDLFNNNSEVEKALISINNGTSWLQYTSNNGPGGYYSTNLGGWGIARIVFKGYSDAVSDYALARISLLVEDPVPEPASAAMILLGLAGLKAIRRRRRHASV